jgi:hypothetical protein
MKEGSSYTGLSGGYQTPQRSSHNGELNTYALGNKRIPYMGIGGLNPNNMRQKSTHRNFAGGNLGQGSSNSGSRHPPSQKNIPNKFYHPLNSKYKLDNRQNKYGAPRINKRGSSISHTNLRNQSNHKSVSQHSNSSGTRSTEASHRGVASGGG